MVSFIKKHGLRIILNVLVLAFFGNVCYVNSQSFKPAAGMRGWFTLHCILYNLLLLTSSYVNTIVLMPKLFLRRKYLAYIASLVVSMCLFSLALSQYNSWMPRQFPGVDELQFSCIAIGMRSGSISWIEYWFSTLPSIFFTMALFSFGYLAQQYFKVKAQQEAIDKKQLESELSLLKSQINPHFLFNVLNSIYSLALKKSDHAPEIVLKLSDIMRYMLYETRQEQVALDKELEMIENYIDIEKIRIGPEQQMKFTVQGDVSLCKIAPVLLIPFVENTVKHGIDSMSENAFVHIAVVVAKGELRFQSVNNYKEVRAKSIGGIGLANVKKRLELLYPGKHSLNIRDENSIFTVSLNISLN